MRKLFKERKLFKGGNYMRKYGMCIFLNHKLPLKFLQKIYFMFYKVSLESQGGNTLHMEKFYYLTYSQIEHEK